MGGGKGGAAAAESDVGWLSHLVAKLDPLVMLVILCSPPSLPAVPSAPWWQHKPFSFDHFSPPGPSRTSRPCPMPMHACRYSDSIGPSPPALHVQLMQALREGRQHHARGAHRGG